MGALLIVLAIILGLFILYVTASGASSARNPSETVYITEERWDPWGWWPSGPWTPHWNPHPFRPIHPLGPGGQHRPVHPLGPGGQQHMLGPGGQQWLQPHGPLGPGGERRLMGGARRS
jgi:hypothetical protein